MDRAWGFVLAHHHFKGHSDQAAVIQLFLVHTNAGDHVAYFNAMPFVDAAAVLVGIFAMC